MPHAAIDVHTHILPPGWDDWAARYGVSGWPSCRLHDACNATIYLGEKEFRKIDERSFAPARRIADMDAERIGLQMISPVPVMFCYWGPAQATDAFARMQNDFIAGVVREHPGRFVGAGTVALQDAALAVRELERLKSLGFPAVEIGAHVNGRDFDDPQLFDFFAAAQQLDMAVFVHPQGPSIGQERMGQYYLPFMVGYPSDSALAAARLILGGVLQRLPRLRICFAHGGGSFPAVLGRLDHGHRVRPEAKRFIAEPPAHYARSLYFDTLTHDARLLAFLLEKFGSERIMIGSDYPFDMGVEHPLAQLDGVGLTPADAENITHLTARRFLRLS
ncbi:MAG: amidohydrolase [Betaproteobacteria bacterium]|nr:amidohydrolase [Betaproteobacteria bacterium]MDH5222758.1 amidohydrolase [Betaproteobacteria bacterium]MDH5351828.1 amidohydrolase [Betaproteobacteria bacterium]